MNILIIYLLLKILLISWFITSYQPLQDTFSYLFDKWIRNLNKCNPIKYKRRLKLIDYLYVGSGCMKCISFILTLIITMNIFYAIGLSMIAELYKKIIK